MREAEIKRKTKETDIEMSLQLDGCGASCVNTGCGFLDHMLTLFAKYARVNLTVSCKGDTEVDYHHTTEDVGIVLGDCIKKALGDMKGICRYGNTILPMDEALVLTALDISGRSYLSILFRGAPPHAPSGTNRECATIRSRPQRCDIHRLCLQGRYTLD